MKNSEVLKIQDDRGDFCRDSVFALHRETSFRSINGILQLRDFYFKDLPASVFFM